MSLSQAQVLGVGDSPTDVTGQPKDILFTVSTPAANMVQSLNSKILHEDLMHSKALELNDEVLPEEGAPSKTAKGSSLDYVTRISTYQH
ncbi:uncharacterized protein N7446_007912 [Penicillium canescens]|uniref:Uncharacterized protein n=1 Tax=Penicillium canescens TaxID=5083 RepID=A0AAD6NDH6_PENCN|nr:uncharacterized protein N7446_007912 [Penicillium canescens]KAJ6033797.1 hypothetical protein N7444_011568 [Penicillium canescens]KAJ6057013.1 hypothetical protein N7460_000287 [Penicillium canescens]KAJ6058329.1 hypothetical protein N7446_007912 [Penicillium canescens]